MSNVELINAVKDKDIEKVKELIHLGVDVNQRGEEQEWTPLNYAAGKGSFEIVRLLVENGADVFKMGKDMRTPYKIALAASHLEVAKYLRDVEENAGGDKDKISSKEFEKRPYCKAYYLKDLRRFSNWSESQINWREEGTGEKSEASSSYEFKDDDVVFIHPDFTVTKLIWHDEDIIFNDITLKWKDFCMNILKFKIPDDFDLAQETANN